jgi:hypothetical protein
MREKLPTYVLLCVFSFAFFTALFHTVAYANEDAGIFPSPSQTQSPTEPTPTIYVGATIEPTDIPTFSLVYPTPTTVQPHYQTITAPAELESLFTSYAEMYNIDVAQLKHIAQCESGFNATSNNHGKYLGMFQFSESTWISNRRAMGLDTNPDLRMNAEESIKTTAFMLARGQARAWPNCH